MSVLESLRKRSGLLVTIVGLALFAFVLTGLFENSSIFGGSDKSVGEIAGKAIEYNAFNPKVQEAIESNKANSRRSSLPENETDEIVQQIWNQCINEEVMTKEYQKLGISVSNDELYDLMVDHPHPMLIRNLSDPQTGKVNPAFADPATGSLSPAKIKEFTQAMNPEQEAQWTQLENYIRQTRIVEKYNNLIKKGMYVTKAEAKQNFIAQAAASNIKFAVKNYSSVPDNAVSFTDEDLKAYYNTHQLDYKQEPSRKLEYVAFDIAPSQEDREAANKEMNNISATFKTNKATEDSSFVIAESDTRMMDETFHAKGTLSPQIDTLMFAEPVGTVVGPYEENGSLKVSKLIATKNSADSAKVRHILISYEGSGASATKRTKKEAKTVADSILALIKKGTKFTEMVDKFSDDGGKTMPPNKKEGDDYPGKGGDYGWLNANSQFVEPFKNAGLDHKKGDILVVESNFGFHIIEVLDAKGSQKKVEVATIERKMEASSKTMQAIFLQASEFAGKNTTVDLFEKAISDNKLNKRVVDNVKENDKTIAGIESARPLIRWAYETKKGVVSEPKEFGNKYVVAVVTDIREKGFATLEQVKDDVTAKVIKEKKAELFTTEFNTAMAGGASIDAIASKLKLGISQVQNINFNSNSIQGAGNEAGIIGAISVQKANTLSKPLKGKEGVFLVYTESVTAAPALTDYTNQQKMAISQLQPRVDYEVYDALKTNANIVEHLVKFY